MKKNRFLHRPDSAHDDDALALAPVIAIIGCDGAGKSTLAAYLCDALREERSAYAYLGLGSGAMGLKIRAFPFIGKVLERYLSAKATQARSKTERIPGVLTALTIYGFARLRVRRFNRMLALRETAGIVLCDRYPQLDVPGLYDGPGLSAARPRGPFTAWLAKRERALYERMVQVQPSLIIRLHIDAQTAHRRKPDHDLALIEQKVAVTPLLRFNCTRIVEVNACLPLETIKGICLRIAQQLITECSRTPSSVSVDGTGESLS